MKVSWLFGSCLSHQGSKVFQFLAVVVAQIRKLVNVRQMSHNRLNELPDAIWRKIVEYNSPRRELEKKLESLTECAGCNCICAGVEEFWANLLESNEHIKLCDQCANQQRMHRCDCLTTRWQIVSAADYCDYAHLVSSPSRFIDHLNRLYQRYPDTPACPS